MKAAKRNHDSVKRTHLIDYLPAANQVKANGSRSRPVIGVLEGTGIGPSVVGAALRVLDSVVRALGLECEVQFGGLIGEEAIRKHGKWLPETTIEFCGAIFESGGAILSGPGGGRYVYDLRRRFDLFCKFVPVRSMPGLSRVSRIAPQYSGNVDLLVVRDNTGGVYQGSWNDRVTNAGRVVEHSFSYNESQVFRIVEVAARASAQRRGVFHVIVKEGGLPTVTGLWREVSEAVAQKHGLRSECINIDLAAYEVIQNPGRFDVIVAPNLFGDIIADICGVLVSSRGVTFSGNFNAPGNGVYQTNHGCAHDLAGADTANPGGQILSLAMLLRESFGLDAAAELVEKALFECWREGWRTADIAEPGATILGTKAMGDKVAEQVARAAETLQTA